MSQLLEQKTSLVGRRYFSTRSPPVPCVIRAGNELPFTGLIPAIDSFATSGECPQRAVKNGESMSVSSGLGTPVVTYASTLKRSCLHDLTHFHTRETLTMGGGGLP